MVTMKEMEEKGRGLEGTKWEDEENTTKVKEGEGHAR